MQQDGEQVDVLEGPPEALRPSLYVGQSSRILSHGNTAEALW